MGLLMASVPKADSTTHNIIVENASLQGDRSLYSKTLLQHYSSLRSTTYIHEWGHILQNVTYPYLYLRSVRELGFIDTLLARFQKDERPAIPTSWMLSRDAYESMTMDVTLFRFMIAEDGTVSLGAPAAGPRGRNDISEVDLIEEANAIFEFKVETDDYGSGEGYHDWLKKGTKGYTRVYRLLSRLLGRQDAYDLLPALVYAAYHTTYPVTAFASLLHHILQYRSAVDTTNPAAAAAYLVDRLSFTPGINPEEIPELRRLATDDPWAFVGNRAMRRYIEQSEHHPLNILARRVWIDGPARDREWLYHPHRFIRRYGHSLRDEISDLQPPFIWLVYDSEEVPLSAALFLLSDLYRGRKVSVKVDPEGQTEFATYLDMILFRRILIQGLTRNAKDSRRIYCHHEDCDYFNSGLCDEYIRIPDLASNCNFPTYILHTMKRRYSKQSNLLERISENATERLAD
jgi:hypothetical protein